MKINQVITESKSIKEAPASALTQFGRSIGSKVLNKVGAKSMAQNMAGRADLGATANKLHQQYSRYLGVRNKNVKNSTGVDLKDFLASKNVTVNVPPGRIDPARLDKMLLKIARDAMTNKKKPTPAAGAGNPPANPSAGTPPAGNPAPGTPPATPRAGKATLAQVRPMVSALRKRDQQRLLADLQKALGTATPPAANPTPAPVPPTPAPSRGRKRTAPPAP